MSALLPFAVELAPAAGPVAKLDMATSAAETMQFGAALEQALLAAATTTLPHPPLDNAPLIDLAAALTEFGEFDAPPAEAAQGDPEALPSSSTEAPTVQVQQHAMLPALSSRPLPTRMAGINADAPQVTAPMLDVQADTTPTAGAAVVLVSERTESRLPLRDARDSETPEPTMPLASSRAALQATPEGDDAGRPDSREPMPATSDAVDSSSTLQTNAVPAELAALLTPVAPRLWHGDTPKLPESSSAATTEAPVSSAASTDDPTGERAAIAVQQAVDAAPRLRASLEADAPTPAAQAPALAAAADAKIDLNAADASAPIVEPGTDAAVGFTLPAGMHVLALHTQHARRQIMTRQERPSGMESAPRTSASAVADLSATTEMPTVAAEAIEQLRRPVPAEKGAVTLREPRAQADSGAVLDRIIERRAEPSSDGLAEEERTAATLTSALAQPIERVETPTPAAGQGRDLGMVRTEPQTSSAGNAAPLAAAPAPTPIDPAELQKLKYGVERISVRLGEDAADPVVRISIRGDAIDARISTTDQGLARELGSHARELRAALEAKGFEQANVHVRGTGSAIEGASPAHLAGPSITESRDAKQSGSEESRQSPDERAQAWKDDRPDQRRQRAPRRFRLDDDEQP